MLSNKEIVEEAINGVISPKNKDKVFVGEEAFDLGSNELEKIKPNVITFMNKDYVVLWTTEGLPIGFIRKEVKEDIESIDISSYPAIFFIDRDLNVRYELIDTQEFERTIDMFRFFVKDVNFYTLELTRSQDGKECIGIYDKFDNLIVELNFE